MYFNTPQNDSAKSIKFTIRINLVSDISQILDFKSLIKNIMCHRPGYVPPGSSILTELGFLEPHNYSNAPSARQHKIDWLEERLSTRDIIYTGTPYSGSIT
ncbi:hypothetical protein NP493_532g03046 [Ridgeia piscesae]|uniref:Uncharacterized protein n=1 Tax=Ridgeia piscesae TaxID=27915 RepID=A0AAD9KW05_RIDPI|nr:hypothetical protein NP493_532g03046 [Ridgeia piscesae]